MTTEVINIQIREDGSRVVTRNIEGMGNAADRTGTQISGLARLLGLLASAFAVDKLARYADEYTNLQNRLRLVTTGTENLKRVTGELLTISNQTRSDFTATGELYARLASTTKELGLSQQQMLNFTKSLNQAIVLSGATAAEAAGGLRQLSQGLASGTLRGDELNSVLENFPKVAQIIAEGMGHSIGEIRKLGAEGKISAQAIIDAFAKASDQLDKDFATTVPTLSQSFTVLKNNFLVFIGQLNESTGITSTLSKLIIDLANNLDTIIPIIAAVGVAIATAFAPGVIASFMSQLKLLWTLVAANPFVAFVSVLAGVITLLYNFRDQIKLGIDDTTTLGDLMRAAWETIGPLISGVADTIKSVLGFITEEFKKSVTLWTGYTFDSTEKQESSWLSLLRTIAQVFDRIGATVRAVMTAVGQTIGIIIGGAVENFRQLGKVAVSALKGDFEGVQNAISSVFTNSKEVIASVGQAWGDAFTDSFASQAENGLEAGLNRWIERAQQIGKDRLAAAAKQTQGDLGGGHPAAPKPPVVDPKAAKELERLKNALMNVQEAASGVVAAQHQLAEAEDILTKSVKAGLISQKDAVAVYEELKYQLRDQLDPLAAVNRELDQHIAQLKLSNDQARIEADLLQYTQQLRQAGVKLSEEELAQLRAKLVVEQQLEKIARARDEIQRSSGGQELKDFTDQVTAMRQLLDLGREGGGLGQGDVASQLQKLLPWANLENTQGQMDAYVQAHADMYAQIAELEKQQVINHQTAEMLKAQADATYMEQRLASTKSFFSTLAGLSSSSNRRLASIGKAAAIAQATIDGVLAVQKALAAAPYPYNIPGAIAAGAMAAANVASIANQQVGFRTGGEFTVGGQGGSDSQLVAFRATPGERVYVNTPAQDRALRERRDEGPRVSNTSITVNVPPSYTNRPANQLAQETALAQERAQSRNS